MSETDGKYLPFTEAALDHAEATLNGLAHVYFPHDATAPPSARLQPDLEARYRTLIEQIPAVVFIAPLDEGIGQAYVSPQIESIVGFTQEEWLEDPVRWYRHIHPEDRARWSLEASHLFVSGEPLRSVYRVIARDGQTVWLHCEAKMVRRPDGLPWFIHGVGFNVTELKHAEESLRKAHDELEQRVQKRTRELTRANVELDYQAQLIVQAPDPVIAVNNHGIVTSWNAAATRVLGWTEPEAVGRPLDQVVRDAPGSTPAARIREVLAQSGRFEGELAWLTRSGNTIVVEATITLLRGASGETIGLVGGFKDITERRRAEEALKRSEQRLLLVTETAPIGILLFDPAGRIVFANSLAAAQLGLSAEEIARRPDDPLAKLTHADGQPIPGEHHPVRQAIATRRTISGFRAAFLTLAGKRVYLSISSAPILDAAGQVEGVVMAFEDITARRELEEQYRHSQKMESLGRLAGGVAHDFNNLLTVINGYSSLLLRKSRMDGQLKTPLEEIHKAGKTAADLCRQLLAFSRRQIDSPGPLSLNGAVRSSEKLLRRLLGDGIDLAVDLDPVGGTVLSSSGPIQQVLMNLVVNARDAMPHGGRVSIATRNIESPPGDPLRDGDAGSGPYAVLTVEDTGVGMNEETRRRIFEPYFTTKATGKGTGLGLSTVYGIVKQSGGWIRVESEPRKGSRFSIYLPRVEAAEAAPSPVESTVGGSEIVLVVEDQPAVRNYLVECLRSAGYAVLAVASGQEALEVARAPGAAVDLLVTDMMMPGISGRQLAEVLATERPGLPVVLVSGYSTEQIEPLGLPNSQFTILGKPVDPDTLAEAVWSLLKSRSVGGQRPDRPLA